MLRHLIHLRYRLSDLGDACRLLAAGGTDLAHDVGHPAYGADDLVHGGSGLVHQRCTLLHALDAGTNQGLDFFRRFCRTTRQGAHLRGHHGKATPLLAGAGCLNGRVQRQDVGLKGNTVDDTDDVGNPARTFVDALHGLHHLSHHFSTLRSHSGGVHCQLVGLACVISVLFDL